MPASERLCLLCPCLSPPVLSKRVPVRSCFQAEVDSIPMACVFHCLRLFQQEGGVCLPGVSLPADSLCFPSSTCTLRLGDTPVFPVHAPRMESNGLCQTSSLGLHVDVTQREILPPLACALFPKSYKNMECWGRLGGRPGAGDTRPVEEGREALSCAFLSLRLLAQQLLPRTVPRINRASDASLNFIAKYCPEERRRATRCHW